MVFPSDRVLPRLDGESLKVPRARFFVAGPPKTDYVVMIASRKKNPLTIARIGAYLYGNKNYKDKIDIYFVTKKKVKIIASTLEIANDIATDVELNVNYSTYIPSEICEVKGVAPIPDTYSEEEIFTNGTPKNISKFGPIAEYCRLAEVKRFTRRDPVNRDKFLPIETVLMCFSGDKLPSHISVDGVHYPVNPYRENVMQCRKCYHFNHSEGGCTKKHPVCEKCGCVHEKEKECLGPIKCVNCGGEHSSTSKLCPIYKKMLNIKIQKANLLRPKPVSIFEPSYSQPVPTSFSSSILDFPALSFRKPVETRNVVKTVEVPKPKIQKKVATKRTRMEAPEVAVEEVLESGQQKVCDDLQKIVKSQISTSSPTTIEAIKPFFEAVFNTINSKETTPSEDSLKPVLTDIVNFLNSLSTNNCDEVHTAQLY